MKKKSAAMKKVVSLVLGLVMVMGLAVPVMAQSSFDITPVSSIEVELPGTGGLTMIATNIHSHFTQYTFVAIDMHFYAFVLGDNGTISFNQAVTMRPITIEPMPSVALTAGETLSFSFQDAMNWDYFGYVFTVTDEIGHRHQFTFAFANNVEDFSLRAIAGDIPQSLIDGHVAETGSPIQYLPISSIAVGVSDTPPTATNYIENITIALPGTQGITATLTNAYNHYYYFALHGTDGVQITDTGHRNFAFFLERPSTVTFNTAVELVHPYDAGSPDRVVPANQVITNIYDSLEIRTADGNILLFTFYTIDGAVRLEYFFSEEFLQSNLVGIHRLPLSNLAVSVTAPNLTTASNWAHGGINQAFTLGLIPQALQNNYTANATRAEFSALAVALYETLTGRTITGRMQFNDTNDINVQKMGYLGIVTGVGGGNFAPENGITREQAAVMITRLANAIGQPFPIVAPTFADNAQLSSWAEEAVGQVQAAGIMGGVGNNQFNPSGQFTREQSIITMLRLLEILN